MKDVEWIVNDMGELGVKINDQFFFLYKGYSYRDGKKWRHVFKREFGEICYPWDIRHISGETYNIKPQVEDYVGYHGEDFSEWKDIPKGEE